MGTNHANLSCTQPAVNWLRTSTIKVILIVFTCLTIPVALSSCGFHLRGYDTPMTYVAQSAVLRIDSDATSFPLKRPLKNKLSAVGVTVIDDIGHQINKTNQVYNAVIQVDNVRFKKYELVGVLTEIRLVLSADVTYQTMSNVAGNGVPVTVKNPIQVERNYQFNEASVSVEDQQGEQVRDWLYDSLAKRIADQYVALSLPRVPPPSMGDVDASNVVSK